MAGWRVRFWLYAAALAAGLAFSVVFTGDMAVPDGLTTDAAGKAFATMLGATLVALAVGSAGAYRFILIPPAAVLYTVLAVYGWPPYSLSGWRDLLLEIGNDVYAAGEVMYAQTAPYDIEPGLLVLLVPLVVVLVAFSTSMTLYEGSPVVSVVMLGVTVAVLSTSNFEAGIGPYFFFFLVSAVALLLNAGSRGGAGGPGRLAVAAGAVLVLVILLLPRLPYSDLTVAPGLVDWRNVGNWGNTRLDVQADVGDYLDGGRDLALLRVQTSEPLRWRGGTLDYFDGVRWSDTTEPGDDVGEEISSGVPTRYVQQRFEVLNARTELVFGGYKIVGTSLEDAEQNVDGSWRVDAPLERGTTYRVVTQVPQPTPRQLRAAGEAYPAAVRERFLQLPENVPEVVSETAQMIDRRYNPATPYDSARAIEQYLRFDGGFIYNLDADFRRADRALEDFLSEDGAREGFCTQFATSMALLARDRGIPSRVVYGATQGRQTEPGEYVVTGANMHTWVELYFPGVGWYPFDPTPGFMLPFAMERNAPRPEIPISQQDLTPQGPDDLQEQPSELPADQEDGARDAGTTGERPAGIWTLLFAAPLVLLAVPALKRVLLTRGRPQDLYRDLTGRLRDHLPPGHGSIADSYALTPTERILILAGASGLDEKPFREFARAYSDHLYAPNPGNDVGRAYRAARRELDRLPRWRRVLAAINPASLAYRARKGLGVAKKGFGKRLRGKLRGRFPRGRPEKRR